MQRAFQRPCTVCIRLEAATRKPIHELGVLVRLKASLSLLLILAAVAAFGSDAQSVSPSQPVTSSDLVAWLAGGVSSARLVRIVGEHGLANLPTHAELKQLESAGAGKDLIKAVTTGKMQ